MHDYLTNCAEATRRTSVGIAALSGHNRVFQHTRNEGCFVCEALAFLMHKLGMRERGKDDTLILVEIVAVYQTWYIAPPKSASSSHLGQVYFGAVFLHKSLESFVWSLCLPPLPSILTAADTPTTPCHDLFLELLFSEYRQAS